MINILLAFFAIAVLGYGVFVCAKARQTKRTREVQYDDQFVALLETLWGEGFLSPGGSKHVDFMFEGLDLKDKKLLDIGCGIGGPELYLAQKHGACVVGIDVEPNVIIKAQAALAKTNFTDRVLFQIIAPEANLPFQDNHFDVVFSKESILHVKNKLKLFKEALRVLKPGGEVRIFDWLHSTPKYSQEMEKFVVADGLIMHLITPNEYRDVLQKAGFENVELKNTSDITIEETRDDLRNLAGQKGQEVRKKFGEDQFNEYLESWTLQLKAFESGQAQTYLIRAKK